MMANPATTADVTGRGFVMPAGLSDATVQVRLDEAWRALHYEDGLSGLDLLIESGEVDADLVIDVVSAAAMRVLRNPEGWSEESASLDDYRESGKRADATQDLYFTAAELRRLRPTAVLPVGFAGSFRYA